MCEEKYMSTRTVLIILDGFGIGRASAFNAVKNARMPFYRDLLSKYPHSQLITHGEAVGLPPGVMGNSEVGHMTIGAGRIIFQDLSRISRSITTGEFSKNPVLRKTLETGASKTGRVHLMGLLSDGGVHSHIDHLFALLDLCMELRIPKVSVHPFLDGRDTPPSSAPGFLEKLLHHPSFQKSARIATLMGRYWAMDRDQRWERTQKAYITLTGQVHPSAESPEQALQKSYEEGITDEFVKPVSFSGEASMQEGDSVVFLNFRSDRARQITHALVDKNFRAFNRRNGFSPSAFAGLTTYDKKLPPIVQVAFPPQNLEHIFGEWLEEKKLSQFRTAETEKYAHVTFFFNGGREKPFEGEDRTMIPSPKDVPTYDLRPEMNARAVSEEAAARIEMKKYDFVLMNFANADMVGHTGNYGATLRAVETLDACLARVVGAAEKNGYHVLLTADHGNAEEMRDDYGHIHTQHTLNPVPVIWVAPNTANAPRSSRIQLKDGSLKDIMPTLCELMNIGVPTEVTGQSLLPPGSLC